MEWEIFLRCWMVCPSFSLMKIASWNVRRLNHPLKAKGVCILIYNDKLSLLGVLETRVKDVNSEKIMCGVAKH